MMQCLARTPGALVAMLLIIVLLHVGAVLRIRRDRLRRQRRRLVDRRGGVPRGPDRRWQPRPHGPAPQYRATRARGPERTEREESAGATSGLS